MKPENEWELIGLIAVDAGLCWIGDPCHIFHKEDDKPTAIGKNWSEFCLLGDEYPTKKAFGFNKHNEEGLGICVSTGYGDGIYPVYARTQNGRITQIFIKFDEE